MVIVPVAVLEVALPALGVVDDTAVAGDLADLQARELIFQNS
jgi:hypothetical protein